MSGIKKKKPKKKASVVLFFVELVVLIVLVCGIFLYAKINEGLGQIGSRSGAGTTAVAANAAAGGENVAGGNTGTTGQGTVEGAAAVQQQPSEGTAAVQQPLEGTDAAYGDTVQTAAAQQLPAEQAVATGATTLSGETVTHVGTDADPNADADAAEENEGVSANEAIRGYTNILLVGIDTRDVNQIDYANSDTMIIASINNDTGKVRMISVYRDTLLNVQDNYSMTLAQGDSDEEPAVGEDEIEYFEADYEEEYTPIEEDYNDGGYDDGGYDDGGYDDGGGNGGGDDGYYEDQGSDEGSSHNSESYYSEPDTSWTPVSSTPSTASSSSSSADSTISFYTESDVWSDYASISNSSGTSSAADSVSSVPGGTESVFSEPDSEVSEYAGNEYYNYTESGAETTGQQLGETTAAGRYDKANAAYASGSTKQILSMLNRNLDLNIHDIVVVDFSAVAKLVDDIDGIDVWMTYQEIVHMNNYCQETSKVTGLAYTPIEPEEMPREYHLNGVQAVSYARIRYTAGNDMKRTQRQRVVIEKIISKAKKRGLDAVNGMINDVFPLCKTSFSPAEIIKLATQAFNFEIEKTSGFPFEHIEKNVYIGSKKLDCVVPVTLEVNVQELHEFLFDDKDYECSATVKEYSNDISVLSGLTIASRDVAIKNSVIEESGGEADVVT